MTLRRLLLSASVLMVTHAPARAYDLTYQNMLIASMKLNPNFDYENVVDSYMQAFRPAVWQKAHDDEFERHGKQAETLQMMKNSATSFNLNDPVILHANVQFGEYDFKQHQFALSPFSENSYYSVNYCCNALPQQIKLFLSNPSIVDGLPMDEQAAKNFLAQHRQYGNVNRQLTADVSVLLKSSKADDELIGEINKVVIRDPMNRNAIIGTFMKTGS